MKHLITTSFAIALIATCKLATAQQKNTNGFYASANIGFNASQRYIGPYRAISPSFSLGYLHGEKIRHNVSLNNLGFGFGKYGQQANLGLRYSVDFRLYNKNKFSLYASPFVTSNFNYYKSRTFNTANDVQKSINYTFNTGINLQTEYKVSNRGTFTLAIPINLYSINNNRYVQPSTMTTINHNYNDVNPQVGLQLGFRLKLGK